MNIVTTICSLSKTFVCEFPALKGELYSSGKSTRSRWGPKGRAVFINIDEVSGINIIPHPDTGMKQECRRNKFTLNRTSIKFVWHSLDGVFLHLLYILLKWWQKDDCHFTFKSNQLPKNVSLSSFGLWKSVTIIQVATYVYIICLCMGVHTTALLLGPSCGSEDTTARGLAEETTENWRLHSQPTECWVGVKSIQLFVEWEHTYAWASSVHRYIC